MAFLFSKTVDDVIRNRNLYKMVQDKIQQKKRGDYAPQELPNLSLHGITPNGTYFFCNLVYQKDLNERKKITLFNLIDAYANTEDQAERVRLKCQIKEACGEQVEGIALLFSNSSETFGFVTGNRVKVARYQGAGPLELDADELFSDLKHQLKLSFQYFVFILDNEADYSPELIRQYIQGDEEDDQINTEVINAIKRVKTPEKPLEDMSLYLKTAYGAIQNPVIQQQVKAVYHALQLLSYTDREIHYKTTVLTLQLLHYQDIEKRKQLLTDYTKLASMLYGSQIPSLMLVSIGLFLLAASFLVLSILTTPAPLMIIGTGLSMMMGLICAINEGNEFYSDEARQKRSTANTLFDLKKNLDNISEDLIPRKISVPMR